MTMPWIIEARDPLIFRDGRPIGGNAPIATMDFPFPSTLAGAVRGRLASDASGFTLTRQTRPLAELRQIPVRGPLLAEVSPTGELLGWLLPAPRDALVRLDERGSLSLTPLRPQPLPPGRYVDDLDKHGLEPVVPTAQLPPSKPPRDPPVFWRERHYLAWLTGQVPTAVPARDLGIGAFPREARMHLVMKPNERVGEDGGLFETVGLRFVDTPMPGTMTQCRHYALSVACPGGTVAGKQLTMRRELAPLGGERRLARWWPAGAAWPGPPRGLHEQILRTRRARLLLVTPAIFDHGALPGWSGNFWPGDSSVQATVKAACVPSAQIVSGWDMETNKPKPTRRMAASGSVYFVEVECDHDDDLRRWIDATWLQSICDRPEDRRDGFGLAALGVWPETTSCP